MELIYKAVEVSFLLLVSKLNGLQPVGGIIDDAKAEETLDEEYTYKSNGIGVQFEILLGNQVSVGKLI